MIFHAHIQVEILASTYEEAKVKAELLVDEMVEKLEIPDNAIDITEVEEA